MNCENCNKQHEGNYASGRFCSLQCSRGFSTKNKRAEINRRVSEKMKEKGNGLVDKICENCGKVPNEFNVKDMLPKEILAEKTIIK